MKTHDRKIEGSRWSKVLSGIAMLLVIAVAGLGANAQNSLPAPGSGGSYRPNTGSPLGPNGIGWNPGPAPVPGFNGNWGSPWNNGWNNGPTIIVNQSPMIPNQGVTKVVACGYDAQGIWRVLPLTVSFQYNGFQYDVNVLNAWNPWTDQWDRGVDTPAYNTDYYMRGQEYDYYCVLPTGTFYFNL